MNIVKEDLWEQEVISGRERAPALGRSSAVGTKSQQWRAGPSCYYARRSNYAAIAGGQSRQWGLRGSVHPLCLVDFGNPNLALGGPHLGEH